MKTKKQIKADRLLLERMHELHSLLNYYGLTLLAYDPGICAGRIELNQEFEHYDFSQTEWNWLEPLLVELRNYREKYKGV